VQTNAKSLYHQRGTPPPTPSARLLLTGCFVEWLEKELTIEERMQKAKQYAGKIHKLSQKVDWEMVKLCHKSRENHNRMQEAHRELKKVCE